MMWRFMIFGFAVICSGIDPAFAGWVQNGLGICRAGRDQFNAQVVSDGSGGAIAVWSDFRNESHWDLFAQRVDLKGQPSWTANGVPVCLATNVQDSLVVTADGSGGVIAAWQDFRNGHYDIYAQRLNGQGAPLWTVDGTPVCVAPGHQTLPAIASDSSGGCFLAWQDARSGNSDIFVAHVNAAGAPTWTPDGVGMCLAGLEQTAPRIASDGVGGALVAWEDLRAGTADIYARRVNSSGTPLWAPNGIAVCSSFGSQTRLRMESDAQAGALIFWEDRRAGTSDIYGDRIDATGQSRWFADGLAICNAIYEQTRPTVTADGAGGAIVAWEDSRTSGSYPDIYAQRINELGVFEWVSQGVLLSTQYGPNNFLPNIVSDGNGGAYVAWEADPGPGHDIFVNRVNGAGLVGWGTSTPYTIASAAAYSQRSPSLVLDGTGGVIVAWEDSRTQVARDIYAQRIEPRHGAWGHPEPEIDQASDAPGDEGGFVALDWNASQRDLEDRSIDYYSIWRATRDAAQAKPLRAPGVSVSSPSSVAKEFEGSATWLQPSGSGDFFWEWVDNQEAMMFSGYSYAVPTRADSTAASNAKHYFLVVAHSTTANTFWPSPPESASSVDNLSPPALSRLQATRQTGHLVQLDWSPASAEDLSHYAVYRSRRPPVIPDPATFLGGIADTLFEDTTVQPGISYFYAVAAVDVHGNEGPLSPESQVSGSTGIDASLSPLALMLLPNAPNPFRSSTAFRLGLGQRADVSIRVFDVRGRLVRTLQERGLEPGWHDVPFDGRNAQGRLLASGIYTYRVASTFGEDSGRFIIAR